MDLGYWLGLGYWVRLALNWLFPWLGLRSEVWLYVWFWVRFGLWYWLRTGLWYRVRVGLWYWLDQTLESRCEFGCFGEEGRGRHRFGCA